jgi:hypothetical protein
MSLLSLDEVTNLCTSHMDKNKKYMLKSSNGKYLILLEMLDDTFVNNKRAGLWDINFAKCRGNKFRNAQFIPLEREDLDEEKKIDHINNVTIITEIIKEKIYQRRIMTSYILNEIIEEINYDKDVEIICGKGIHCYHDISAAFYHERRYIAIEKKFTGSWIEYHANGTILTKFEMIDGEIDGPYVLRDQHGMLIASTHYNKGVLLKQIGWLDDKEIDFTPFNPKKKNECCK